MKREELARALADKEHVSRAAARDTLDAMIHQILTQLREGHAAEMPGVGKLISPKQTEQKRPSKAPAPKA